MSTQQIVAFMPAWLDACALFRMFLPHLHTAKSRFLFNIQRMKIEDFAEASIAVVQRQCTENNIKALQRFREMGIKIVYDLDDNLWNLPGYNPGKQIFKIMREGFATCIHLCDVITVSTEGLKTAVRTQFPSLRKEIVVVPNAIDLELLKPSKLSKGDGVVVGWGGTNTHFGDVNTVWKVISELVLSGTLPDVRFEFVGLPPPKAIYGHERVKERLFVPVAEYFTRLSTWAWDVSVAPLEENRFNNSKSAIKMLEAAAVGMPILVSPVGPYANFCKLHSELPWLQCQTAQQWRDKIVALASDGDMRKHYADVMLDVVKEHYDIRNVVRQWQNVFEAVA